MNVRMNLFDVTVRGTLKRTDQEQVVDQKSVRSSNQEAVRNMEAVEFSLGPTSPLKKIDDVEVYKNPMMASSSSGQAPLK